MKRVNCFNAIRMFFASLVVLCHSLFILNYPNAERFFFTFLDNGRFAVTFFFIMSGFCIYNRYAVEFCQNVDIFHYKRFIVRRLTKIYPLYMVTCLIAAIFDTNFLEGGGKDSVAKIFKAIFMLQSLSWNDWSIFNSAAWFVSSVFVLYLITPLLIYVVENCINNWLRHIICLCLAFPIFELFIMNVLVERNVLLVEEVKIMTYVFPIHNMPYYLMGMICAIWYGVKRGKVIQ